MTDLAVTSRRRLRIAEGSPERLLRVSVFTLALLAFVVGSGAFVRLTGSGLGCENWPRCGDLPFPARGYHAFIEFGNRVIALIGILGTLATWLVARRTTDLDRRVVQAALAVFAMTFAQIPLGGITVILELHPLAVMSHFLLAMVTVAVAVCVVLEAWSATRGLGASPAPGWLRWVSVVGIAACAVMVVTGAVATASGPHPGDSRQVERLGLTITDTVYVHVRATAVFGIGLLIIGAYLWRLRAALPGVVKLGLVLLGVLCAQMVVGEVQYRNALPWGLVLVHVTLAGLIWALTVAVAYATWRPPAPLAAS
ncbi:MAG: COX15/CtaA family protein [Gaiellales bacterium]